jgi:hypothetical protein
MRGMIVATFEDRHNTDESQDSPQAYSAGLGAVFLGTMFRQGGVAAKIAWGTRVGSSVT